MEKIKYPSKIDISLFDKKNKKNSTLFGLPEKVTFCKKCIMSNQKPNSTIEFKNSVNEKKETINFDDKGICDACNFSVEKKKIDWIDRNKKLEEICDKYRSSDGFYDCIAPGSGGKDSFYASHILKTKYRMNPLTVTWAPSIYTDWGWRNFQRWIHAGHDNYLMTPNAKIHRLLTRLSIESMLHPFQPFILGQKTLAAKMALLFNIPLIFYGENEAEYGNPISTVHKAGVKRSLFSVKNKENEEMFFGGISMRDLINNFGLKKVDFKPYMPADIENIEKNKIEFHYLGYYLKWHPQSCYYYSVEHGNFEASPERTSGTYSKYNSIDDKMDDLHYYTTLVKFGIGRATYDAAQEIRSGDITRDEGVALVNKFDQEYPKRFLPEILKYISLPKEEFPNASKMFECSVIDKEYFDLLCNNFRSPHLWFYEDNKWKLRNNLS
ncbi:N-acetyl sugar amidotransferase [Pelagibacteraceae bacterium]|nr:N-acetyl sugar amidotransferase [Pelagibacteraceae bacterium]